MCCYIRSASHSSATAIKGKRLCDARTYSKDTQALRHTPVQWTLTGLSDLSPLAFHFWHARWAASLWFGSPVHWVNWLPNHRPSLLANIKHNLGFCTPKRKTNNAFRSVFIGLPTYFALHISFIWGTVITKVDTRGYRVYAEKDNLIYPYFVDDAGNHWPEETNIMNRGLHRSKCHIYAYSKPIFILLQ